ncbi:MAG: TRAP transporter substrate-binding protein DctP [Chloroflexaceae bacterium]|jgi:TRAP-type mannitol/chloroaromatic compound transport system substrate-binding protein|nr:TRAP transporter substrate-binding protein DctP [Chloroflexaceae bacterium]
MKRRQFLRSVAAGVAGVSAVGLAACTQQQAPAPTTAPAAAEPNAPQAQAPAQSSGLPALEWVMPTSWGPSIPVLFDAATLFATRVGEITEGRFKITAEPGGKIVPALQILEAIENGTAPIGHTASFYWVGRDPAWAIGTTLPFGLTTSGQNAWLYSGGGRPLLDEFYAENGVVMMPAGNTTNQAGGWFKREINTVADLQGLKMRIPGLGGQVMTRLGVTTQNIAGGEIFQALQTGTVDAAEFTNPVDEEKMGFNNAAEFYYMPSWWEPGATLDVMIDKEEYDKLPAPYQAAIKAAAAEANITSIARYDAENAAALKRMVDGGTKLRFYSDEIMTAAQKAAFELYGELSSNSPAFKKIYDQWQPFRESVYSWHQTNEFRFMNFAYNNKA